MMIDETTTREDLVKAINDAGWDALEYFMDRDIDPHLPSTPTEAIRETLIAFIQSGDECAGY